MAVSRDTAFGHWLAGFAAGCGATLAGVLLALVADRCRR